MRKMGKRIATLHRVTEISDEEVEEFTDIISRLINFIFVDAPQETLDKLADVQQMEVIGAFTKLLTAGMSEGEIAEAEEKVLEQIEAENKKKSENEKNKKPMNS